MEITQQTGKKRRTACYARVSTSDQKNGLEAQLRALRLYCEQNNIADFEFFADENQSGAKSSRPALDRMMKSVQAGEIDNVVAFAFSRYARSVSHMLKGLEVFKKHGTNFVSLTEKIDLNTSLGNVVFILTGKSMPPEWFEGNMPKKITFGLEFAARSVRTEF